MYIIVNAIINYCILFYIACKTFQYNAKLVIRADDFLIDIKINGISTNSPKHINT